ncbi:ejaculatory bulb-specific protein 3-like [Uranotaenia lowii]|uniref:ejaculatory bulb-specific protein 3-like n=1 Tax=Uranotaenia lowii TaxID=190385 RepID=UPI0024784D2E|nr:ejaculatory bulb-specific protein 3-like [Uranotaenia lowii]
MKILVLLTIAAGIGCRNAIDIISTTNADEVTIVKSNGLSKNYYNCPLGQAKCPPDARKTDCAKCSHKQKETGYKVIEYLSANRPKEWAALKAKYDPDNKYVEKYRENVGKIEIKL